MLHQTPLQLCLSIFNLAGRGSKEENMARGVGGGAIIQGRQLFLIFPSKGGDYSREAIN